jgi:uncharacterized membrane protein
MVIRLLKHLFIPGWWVTRVFPPSSMENIAAAIREAESQHQGQICFAVEASLDLRPLLKGQGARQRAIEVFSGLRVWDTEQNNGILIYLLYADRDVEIVADRGINAYVGGDEWERICQEMEACFRQGRFEAGVIAGIRAVSAHLARHYPGEGNVRNELPDRPVVL